MTNDANPFVSSPKNDMLSFVSEEGLCAGDDDDFVDLHDVRSCC